MPITTEPNHDIDLDAPLWGAKAMAPVVRKNEREVRHLINTGLIDVTKVGSLYVTTKRRLLASLGVR